MDKDLKEIEDILDNCSGGGDIIIYESVERISKAILTWHDDKVLEARIDDLEELTGELEEDYDSDGFKNYFFGEVTRKHAEIRIKQLQQLNDAKNNDLITAKEKE